jgi:hypothetical protein
VVHDRQAFFTANEALRKSPRCYFVLTTRADFPCRAAPRWSCSPSTSTLSTFASSTNRYAQFVRPSAKDHRLSTGFNSGRIE